jgi:hypothetical protein
MTPEQPTDRAEINRANSQLSTGPRTVAGKLRSSQNALRHGLTSQVALLSTEDPQIYERHLKSFTDEYDPQGATEANLVQALADTAWRLNRIVAIESRLLTETGYNQQLAALEAQSKILANLSLHSQRLSRQFERTAAQLTELQQTRRTQEKQDLDNVLDIMEMYKSKGEPYRPSDDGFVFSELQINDAVRTRTRDRLTAKASEYVHHQVAA